MVCDVELPLHPTGTPTSKEFGTVMPGVYRLSPEYCAVRLWFPCPNVACRLAWARFPASTTGACPITVVPSRNCTVPVGWTAAGLVPPTNAVIVDCMGK